MKGYKAFNKGLVCRGKRYTENTVFEEENAEFDKSRMCFCQNPLDVLSYHPLVDNEGNVVEFTEVEALDDVRTQDGKEFCTKKLKIGSKLSLSQFIEAIFDFASQNIKSQAEVSDGETLIGGGYAKLMGDYGTKLIGDNNAKLVGDYGAKLIGGDWTKLIGDDDAKLIGGGYAELVGGNNTTLVGCHNAKLVGGDNAILVGGDDTILAGNNNTKLVGGVYATLTGGYNSILVGDCGATLMGGDNAKLVGDYATKLIGGSNAIIVGDRGSTAKGKKGSIIVLVERDGDLNIVNFKAAQVDGEKIKEDTLYKLEHGEFVEVKE